MRKTVWIVFALLAMVALAAPARADVTLTNLNSTVVIDPSSTSGMYTWTVDGVDQMFQQWFWYRVGLTGGEFGINTLGTPVIDQGARFLDLTYTGANGLVIDILYTLTGGTAGSGTSDVAETIRVINNTGSALGFHFFQYSDFDLNGTIGGQTVEMVNANTVTQFGNGVMFSETVATPAPSYHQVGGYPVLVNLLNDGSPTTLNNASGPFTGDATWAFQWDVTIANGGSFLISKDKNLRPIPEPGSMLLLGTGLIGLAGAVRRRLKK